MTVKQLKNELERFDDNLKVCVLDSRSSDFYEAELVIIEPNIPLYEDKINKCVRQDILYIG